MSFANAASLKEAGAHGADGQDIPDTGLIKVSADTPGAGAADTKTPGKAPASGPAISPETARMRLIEGIAKHTARGDDLKHRAEVWRQGDARSGRFQNTLRAPNKYAELAGTAQTANRLIEDAKKKPALIAKVDPGAKLRNVLAAGAKGKLGLINQKAHERVASNTANTGQRPENGNRSIMAISDLPHLSPTRPLRAAVNMAGQAWAGWIGPAWGPG